MYIYLIKATINNHYLVDHYDQNGTLIKTTEEKYCTLDAKTVTTKKLRMNGNRWGRITNDNTIITLNSKPKSLLDKPTQSETKHDAVECLCYMDK